MFAFSKAFARAAGTVGVVLLLAMLHLPAALAQSDDEASPAAPSVSQPARPPIDTTIRRHGGGDEDDARLPSFRDDRGPNAGMRLEATPGSGMALDTSPLPGELGDTPEGARPLFESRRKDCPCSPIPGRYRPSGKLSSGSTAQSPGASGGNARVTAARSAARTPSRRRSRQSRSGSRRSRVSARVRAAAWRNA